MPGSFCTVCRVRIPKGSRCSRHRTSSPSSRAWHRPGAARARASALRRSDYVCEHPGCDRLAEEVHHKLPAADGGTNELTNLIALCAEHHRRAHA